MKPESPLFSSHDISALASSAVRAEAVRETASVLLALLDVPDNEAVVDTSSRLSDESLLLTDLELDYQLGNYRYGFAPFDLRSSMNDTAKIREFAPFDTTQSELVPGMEIATSLISANLYRWLDRDDTSEQGKMILFRLGIAGENRPLDELRLGADCAYGATVLNDGRIRPFELVSDGGSRTMQSLERTDSTEESGKSVDARVVSHFKAHVKMSELSADTDAAKYNAVMDEIQKFINYRQEN